MIRVEKADEPEDFEEKVRAPGRRAIQELLGDPSAPKRRGPKRKKLAQRLEDIPIDKLPDHWTHALPELKKRYRHLCAYLSMRIHESTGAATVDHFVPKSVDRSLAYEWSNFRLACARINSKKGEHKDILDPFEVQDAWFTLDISNFEVCPDESLPLDLRTRVETTISHLGLNEQLYCHSRQEYFDRYMGLCTEEDTPIEPLPLSWLEREAPFVARALRHQGRLRPGDL